jgi:hypothetical protein
LYKSSDSARHQSKDICSPISQILLKNFIKISLIIKECPEEIMIKLEIVEFFQSLAETLQNKTTSIYTYPPRNGGRPDNS